MEEEKISYTKRRERIKEAYTKYCISILSVTEEKDGFTSHSEGNSCSVSLQDFSKKLIIDSEFYDKWGNKCFDNETNDSSKSE